MKRFFLVGAALLLLPSAGWAQRGVGAAAGIVRAGTPVENVTLSGRVVAVETEPCARTTGRSPAGVHVIVETAEHARLNVHLGPASATERLTAALAVGATVAIEAFRTDRLPDGAVVARTVRVGDETFTLRDSAGQATWAAGLRGRRSRL